MDTPYSIPDEDEYHFIGYVCQNPPMTPGPHDDAGLIVGSEAVMKRYMKARNVYADDSAIHGIYFGELLTGLIRGVPYALDRIAYRRFFPLGKKAGLDLKPTMVRELRRIWLAQL